MVAVFYGVKFEAGECITRKAEEKSGVQDGYDKMVAWIWLHGQPSADRGRYTKAPFTFGSFFCVVVCCSGSHTTWEEILLSRPSLGGFVSSIYCRVFGIVFSLSTVLLLS